VRTGTSSVPRFYAAAAPRARLGGRRGREASLEEGGRLRYVRTIPKPEARKVKRAIFLAVLLLLAGIPAFAGNLYAILFINTEDKGIGCIYDALKMGPFLKDAEKATGLALKARIHLSTATVSAADLKSLKTWAEVVNGWSKADLDREVKALAPTKDDTVIFYYSGHGGRMSAKKGKWPDMALQNDDLVDLQYPVDLVNAKGARPRLMLSFGDCCNSYMDRSVAMKTRSAKSTAALKDLFLDSSGTVIASGCIPGQYSLGGSDGGVFTNSYVNATYNAMNTSWDAVMKNTRLLASGSTDGKQVPQFEVNARGMTVVAANTPAAAPAAQASDEDEAGDAGGALDNGGSSDEDQEAVAQDDGGDGQQELSFLPVRGGKASGTRSVGSSKYPFVELRSASMSARADDLVVSFELAQLPRKLPFNDASVAEDELEYEWGMYIDADGSGEPQYEVCLLHFREGKAKPVSDTIESQCQAAVVDLSDGSPLDAEVEVRVDKNRITLTVPGWQDLFELGREAQVYFTALYYPGGESYIP
jgi:hypothetical protein